MRVLEVLRAGARPIAIGRAISPVVQTGRGHICEHF